MDKLQKIVIGIVSLFIAIAIGYWLIKGDPLVVAHEKKYEAGFVFKNKEQLRYSLKNETIVIPTSSNKFFPKMKVVVNSHIEVVVFVEDDTIYLGMQFDDLEFTINDTQKAEIKKESMKPFLVTLVDGAKIDDILFSSDLNEEEVKQIKGLIETLQIGFYSTRSHWIDEERDSNGVFKSSNSYRKGKEETSFTKKKLEYISLNSPESEIEIQMSNATAIADKKSWLKELKIEEKDLYITKKKAMMSSKLTTDLQRVQSVNSKMLLHSFKDADALRAYLNRSKNLKKSQNSTITKSQKEERVASFFSCMEKGNCNFLDIKRNLMAYLIANPDDYDFVLALLKDDAYKEYHHRIINMLRDLGTPEAQRALVQVIGGSEYSQSNRTQASVSIGFLVEPTEETISALQALRASDDLGAQEKSATYYALGNIASNSQEAYDQIAPDIIKDLKSSTNSRDTIMALGALENTENNDIIQYVEPYLNSVDNAVRRGAVEALRLTDAPEATNALYSKLQTEEYDLVINAIAFSLQNKKDLTPEIVKEVAVKSTQKIKKSNDTMMSKSVDFLVDQSKKDNTDAKDALKTMMTKNLSIEARKRIIRGL